MRQLLHSFFAVCVLALLAGTADAQVSTANRLVGQAAQGQGQGGGVGAIPPSFTPPPGSIYGQRPAGRPTGERYWYTPDDVRVLKIRGDQENLLTSIGTSRKPLPIFSWNLKTFYPDDSKWPDFSKRNLQGHNRRGSRAGADMGSFNLQRGGWTSVAEFEGWGIRLPYEAVSLSSTVGDRMVTELSREVRGSRQDTPFDAGLTRYELWVAKNASTTVDQQGRRGGWDQKAWFFDAYNIVNQSGEVVGSLKVTTTDPLNSTARAVRNSPYLVEATEEPIINRTFTASQNGGKVSLNELPKMLVLTSPGGKDPANYQWSSSGYGSALSMHSGWETGSPRRLTIEQRTYLPDDALPLVGSGILGNDFGTPTKLAPNSNIEETGTEISKFWGKDSSNVWSFRRWQRAEDLFPYARLGKGGQKMAYHKWILETKSDVLYAPNQAGNANSVVLSGKSAPNPDELSKLPAMVVATADVQGFDTGGFRVGLGGQLKNGTRAVFADPDDITDQDVIAVLPVGRFYPDSRIYVAIQYLLLKEDGSPDGTWADAKTARLFYWTSEGGGNDTSLTNLSLSYDPNFFPRKIVFGEGKPGFDPYRDAWMVSVRDLAHTSAIYRLRIFMGIPFKPVAPGTIRPSGNGNGLPGTVANFNGTFGADHMAKVLNANHQMPSTPTTSSAFAEAMDSQKSEFKTLLTSLGLDAGKFHTPSSVTTVDSSEIEKVVLDTTQETGGSGTVPSGASRVKAPFKDANGNWVTQWFEYTGGNQDQFSWQVNVPQIQVGVDSEEAGTIITE